MTITIKKGNRVVVEFPDSALASVINVAAAILQKYPKTQTILFTFGNSKFQLFHVVENIPTLEMMTLYKGPDRRYSI
ncbi:hypothetical protein I8748_12610 [Nostoc sp. CENA67]|uniref:Uncharacterized protein n=1 Tax=Amazonocrinis nigriterrae CENA67 TaxID=2794033 RepID=A0A8J7L748_9NOST|nr:hypothetical protein [Amazonocrinis nigriterrae]MBH8563014.1 hypothetical protein [Amazonocrinis nigriterrae CENA67]